MEKGDELGGVDKDSLFSQIRRSSKYAIKQ
jgi:hypothetical protein